MNIFGYEEIIESTNPEGLDLTGRIAFTGILPKDELSIDDFAAMLLGDTAEKHYLLIDNMKKDGAETYETRDTALELKRQFGLDTEIILASDIMYESTYKELCQKARKEIEDDTGKYYAFSILDEGTKKEIMNELVFIIYLKDKYNVDTKIGNRHEKEIDKYMKGIGLGMNGAYTKDFSNPVEQTYIIARKDGNIIGKKELLPEYLKFPQDLEEFTNITKGATYSLERNTLGA